MPENSKALIFLVDDDELFLKGMEHFLKDNLKNDAEIRSFATGEDCLKVLDENPHVIILDHLLDTVSKDAMSGYEVLKQIKNSHPNIRVIVLSGQEKFSVAAQTILKGAYNYIIKEDDAFNKAAEMIDDILNKISIN